MQKIIPNNHWLRTRPIAHRGLHDISKKVPENSLSAFQQAIKKGFPIELDIRIAKNGEAIVFHDGSTHRISGIRHKVKNININDLKNFKLFNTQEYIPTLKETLEIINGRVPVLIEIKNLLKPGKPEDAVIKLLKSYKGEVALQSFNPRALRYLRKKYPKYLSGLIIGRVERFFLQSKKINQFLNHYASPQFINYHISGNLFISFIEYYRKQNLPILAWTVKSKEEELNARKFAENIVFENYIPVSKNIKP